MARAKKAENPAETPEADIETQNPAETPEADDVLVNIRFTVQLEPNSAGITGEQTLPKSVADDLISSGFAVAVEKKPAN
ncbi:hypothetical protein ACFO4O_04335 [Glaciecola siphonariae]|uniref:Uncharacterized protein n=1 Tax=Glaciecola siphonariae TaxID=521012 RepID=A0ABV9LSA4_9ALTE